jgi:hypothetical protein
MPKIRLTEMPREVDGHYHISVVLDDVAALLGGGGKDKPKLVWHIAVHDGKPSPGPTIKREPVYVRFPDSAPAEAAPLEIGPAKVAVGLGDIVVISLEMEPPKPGFAMPEGIGVVAGYTGGMPVEYAYLIGRIKNNIDTKLTSLADRLNPQQIQQFGESLRDAIRPIEHALDAGRPGSIQRTLESQIGPISAAARTTHEARHPGPTPYAGVWQHIREVHDALSFTEYDRFITDAMQNPRPAGDYEAYVQRLVAGNADMNFPVQANARHPQGGHAIEILRYLTEVFLLREGALNPGRLPALERAREPVQRLFQSGNNDLRGNDDPARRPMCVELIYSYFLEEAGLAQSWKAICLRFQNRRNPHLRDPLANMDVHPLRPLSALLWSYIRSERDWLTPQRRNLEYQYAYGISLAGAAVSADDAVVRRSAFLRAFHALLRAAAQYHRDASDMQVIPDVYPLLSALREVRLYLVDGMHNQYGQMPWQAKVEMLMLKWLMARDEVAHFLPTRPLSISAERWMDLNDVMRRLQGWGETSSRYFSTLAEQGERILLSVRFGPWGNSGGNDNEANARFWVVQFRQEVLEYINAYRAVTGVDLSATVDIAMPSFHLQRQRALQDGAQV